MVVWHIWDFPEGVYVVLNEDFKESFFQEMFKKSGGKRPYARFLSLHQNAVKAYHQGYTYKNKIRHPQAIPLSLFKKSLSLMSISLKENLEKNIIGLKGKRKCFIISNIKLPFEESQEFYRVVAHIIADGSAPTECSPYYANTCEQLRNQFINDLKIFGDVHTSLCKSSSVPMISFPKIITDILSYILNIKFTYPNHLPKLIFNSSDECKSAFLQALFDDEGTISTNLAIKMNNYTLIKEIKNLVENLGIKTTKITRVANCLGNHSYSFNISRTFFKKFEEKIGFVNPFKIKNLKFAINTKNRAKRTRKKEDTENQIMEILKKGNITTLNLANNIQFTLDYMSKFLKAMEKKGKIMRSGFKNKIYWTLPRVESSLQHSN